MAGEYERLSKEESGILEMSKEDSSMAGLAQEELNALKTQKESILKQMESILASDEAEEEFPNEIILEVRAGAGGEEAALFAQSLANMYKKYADSKGWLFSVVNESKTSLGGYKEAVFEMRGKNVYRELRFETGVHRIQRVPETEKMGRVHTSTASVAILPIRKKPRLR